MTTASTPGELPWMVPVPTERSSFTPMIKRHARFNVEVALGQIGAFRSDPRALPARSVLFADLQTNADVNYWGRLGSGRSGVFRDGYLKGIGLTPLAANWNQPGDRYHGSGALLASAACRELLISEYLIATGAGHTIVPCTGVLLRPLPTALRSLPHDSMPALRRRPELGASLAPVDTALQAISVKPAGFARPSNFMWWLHHLSLLPQAGGPLGLFDFYVRLWAACAGDIQAAHSAFGPHDLAERLSSSVVRGTEYLLAAWSRGVQWGSTHNNFTIDGRFLDLEVPTVLPGPLVGHARNDLLDRAVSPDIAVEGHELYLGAEVFHYLAQCHLFVRALVHGLRFLLATSHWTEVEREFTDEFAHALAREFRPPHVAGSAAQARRLVLAHMSDTLELSSTERRTLTRMLRGMSRDMQNRPGSQRSERFRLHRLPCPSMPFAEPMERPAIYVPDFLLERYSRTREPALRFHLAVRRADELTDVDQLLEHLVRTRRSWRRSTTMKRDWHA